MLLQHERTDERLKEHMEHFINMYLEFFYVVLNYNRYWYMFICEFLI